MPKDTVLERIDAKSWANLSLRVGLFIGAWIAGALIAIILLIGIFLIIFSFTSFATITTSKIVIGLVIAILAVAFITLAIVLFGAAISWIKGALYTAFAQLIGGIAFTKEKGVFDSITHINTKSVIRWAALIGALISLLVGLVVALIVPGALIKLLAFVGIIVCGVIGSMLYALICASIYNRFVKRVGPFEIKFVQNKKATQLSAFNIWPCTKWAAVFACLGSIVELIIRAVIAIVAPTSEMITSLVLVLIMAPFIVVFSAAMRAAIYAIYNWAAKKYSPIALGLNQ